KLPQLVARIGAATMIVDRRIGADGAAAADLASPLCLILRPDGGSTTTIRAEETARVLPGDTLKVLRAGDAAPAAASAPAKNDGVAERGAPPTGNALVPGGAAQARSNALTGQSRP